jgi:translation initiation factor 1
VIVVHDFPPTFTKADLEGLARELRHAMGTGGTLRERTIEIQGDQAAKIRAFLEKAGFQVAGVT